MIGPSHWIHLWQLWTKQMMTSLVQSQPRALVPSDPAIGEQTWRPAGHRRHQSVWCLCGSTPGRRRPEPRPQHRPWRGPGEGALQRGAESQGEPATFIQVLNLFHPNSIIYETAAVLLEEYSELDCLEAPVELIELVDLADEEVSVPGYKIKYIQVTKKMR